MKALIKLFFLVISGTALLSCGIHNGYMNNSASVLSEANFSYTQLGLRGTSKTTKVFGIGGLGKEALIAEAKKTMLFSNKLQPNQALANVTVDWKTSFFILVFTTKCTVSADIVEFK